MAEDWEEGLYLFAPFELCTCACARARARVREGLPVGREEKLTRGAQGH